MVEPYPSAIRRAGIAQTDDSDALACAEHIRSVDLAGSLERLLDLSRLTSDEASVVSVEGWIVPPSPDSVTEKSFTELE